VKQATLVRSATALTNPVGTAPGWWVDRDGHIIVAMPGVPSEMTRMWQNEAKPRLQQRSGGLVIFSRTLKVIGIGESSVEELLDDLIHSTAPTVATPSTRQPQDLPHTPSPAGFAALLALGGAIGVARRGYFLEGLGGAQFALPNRGKQR